MKAALLLVGGLFMVGFLVGCSSQSTPETDKFKTNSGTKAPLEQGKKPQPGPAST